MVARFRLATFDKISISREHSSVIIYDAYMQITGHRDITCVHNHMKVSIYL